MQTLMVSNEACREINFRLSRNALAACRGIEPWIGRARASGEVPFGEGGDQEGGDQEGGDQEGGEFVLPTCCGCSQRGLTKMGTTIVGGA